MSILRLLINNRDSFTKVHLQSSDEITAYCGIPESSSLLDAIQQYAQLNSIHSSGYFTLLQRLSALRQTSDQVSTMSSLTDLCLNNAFLVDADVLLVCSTLVGPCSSLHSLHLANNQLTDAAASVLAQWVLTNHTPSLISIDLSSNPWWGEGLRNLFFSLNRCSLQLLVVSIRIT